MRILICDDDACARENIRILIDAYFRRKPPFFPCEIDEFADGNELLSDCGNKDIVFLDIEMPGVNGLAVGKELRRRDRNVIILIVTTFSQYLDESMRFQILGYMTKPIDKRKFERNLENALACYLCRSAPVLVENGKSITRIESRSVIMVEAREKKTVLYTKEEIIATDKSLQYWAGVLPEGMFVQTHRSFLVNLEYVAKFDHETVYLKEAGLSAFLTKRKYGNFKKEFQIYLGLQG